MAQNVPSNTSTSVESSMTTPTRRRRRTTNTRTRARRPKSQFGALRNTSNSGTTYGVQQLAEHLIGLGFIRENVAIKQLVTALDMGASYWGSR